VNSMANRNFPNGKSIYIPHVKPVLLDCNFVVDSTNGNGYGLRNIKGAYISTVYMHTSTTPVAGSPNPEAGIIYVQLDDNYNTYLGGFSGFSNPLSGTPITVSTGSSLTIGAPYTITSLGTTTQAQWVALGVPSTITAAPGVAFIAAATSGSGTGTVQAPLSTGAGIDHMELIGDPSTMNSNNPVPGSGLTLMFACYKNGVLTAPANGTVISMAFYMNDSSVAVGLSTAPGTVTPAS
jgi:hypothetical protein